MKRTVGPYELGFVFDPKTFRTYRSLTKTTMFEPKFQGVKLAPTFRRVPEGRVTSPPIERVGISPATNVAPGVLSNTQMRFHWFVASSPQLTYRSIAQSNE